MLTRLEAAFARLVAAINAVDAKTGGGGADPWSWLKLAADVNNATNVLANVTGLVFNVAANKTYIVDVIGTFQSAATTTGLAVALDVPAGTISGLLIQSTSAAALGGTEQIADNATTGATTGVRAINTNVPFTARFIFTTTAAGTAQLKFRSEINTSNVKMKAGLTAMGIREI